MAGSTILSRLASARLKSVPSILKSNKSALPTISPLKSSSLSSSLNRISGISRSPVELSCLMSMMPLHDAIASARLKSFLAIESQSWGLIPQASYHLGCTGTSFGVRYMFMSRANTREADKGGLGLPFLLKAHSILSIFLPDVKPRLRDLGL